jgi:hypothetical protein
MEERSQIDAMRDAVRGDLERARGRRGSTLLRPEQPPETQAEPELEPEPEGPAAEDAPEPRRGLFSFLRR